MIPRGKEITIPNLSQKILNVRILKFGGKFSHPFNSMPKSLEKKTITKKKSGERKERINRNGFLKSNHSEK
jgi:hypothetical protein